MISIRFFFCSIANPSIFTSTYTSELTAADPSYTRPDGTAGDSYYYESITVNIPSNGSYRFRSDNELDTYGTATH